MRNTALFRGVIGVAAVLVLATGECVPAEVVVIVSAKSSLMTVSRAQISDIYLGKSNQLPGGEPAAPFDLPEASPVRDEFYAKFTGKTAAQIKTHWAKIIFTGRGLPPKEAPSSAEVKKAVAANPRAIGYVDPSVVDASVRVVGTQ